MASGEQSPNKVPPTVEGKGPALLIYFHKDTQSVQVLADNEQVLNPDFTVALLEMALNDQKYAQQLLRLQLMQQKQMQQLQDQAIAQQIRGSKVGRS
jgi:hypothetical protein